MPRPWFLLLVATVLAATATEDVSARSVAEDCRRVSIESRANGYSPRLLAMGDPSRSLEASPPVWQNRDRALMGVVARRERGRYRLRVCTVAARELGAKTARTVRQTGATVSLGKDVRAVDAFVANDWLMWVEAPRAGRFRVHRQTLGGKKRSSRTFRGQSRTVAMTRNGTIALSTLSGHTQHMWRWPVRGRTSPLAASRTLALSRAGEPKNPTGLQLWDPDSFLLTPPDTSTVSARTQTDPGRVTTEPGGTACTVWSGRTEPGETPARTSRLSSPQLVAALTDTNTWSLRGQYDGEDWYFRPSVTRLEACDPATGDRIMAVDAGYDTDDYSTDYDAIESLAVVGDGIFATGQSASGETGSGATSSAYDLAYVRDPKNPRNWITSNQHVATRGAAAWVAADQVWVLDDAGVRPVIALPPDFKGLRLTDGAPTLSIVATSSTTRSPLAAVPPGSSAFPPDASASPYAARLPNGAIGAANFGVCSDQFARYCGDPDIPADRYR